MFISQGTQDIPLNSSSLKKEEGRGGCENSSSGDESISPPVASPQPTGSRTTTSLPSNAVEPQAPSRGRPSTRSASRLPRRPGTHSPFSGVNSSRFPGVILSVYQASISAYREMDRGESEAGTDQLRHPCPTQVVKHRNKLTVTPRWTLRPAPEGHQTVILGHQQARAAPRIPLTQGPARILQRLSFPSRLLPQRYRGPPPKWASGRLRRQSLPRCPPLSAQSPQSKQALGRNGWLTQPRHPPLSAQGPQPKHVFGRTGSHT
ncbi:hypothetical protein G5714_005756 [Onychostoma macrolepis]|uniref:Uncharacterized protein n=1 Tax=Onychostoma macrolepis TaxID=369639 RepID=A0A7J6D1Z9_9TELE|nr:hypothetical protein G5714_005756 [Onychostoma macrolepis]